MSEGREGLVNPGDRLPDLTLPLSPDGAPHRLRAPGRLSRILLLVHPAGCEGCAAFARELEAEGEEIRAWDGRVLRVAPEAGGEAPLSTLADPEGRLAGALGLRPPAVVVADRWGQVHEAREAGDGHDFLPVPEIVSWLRFLAVQCPECQGEAY